MTFKYSRPPCSGCCNTRRYISRAPVLCSQRANLEGHPSSVELSGGSIRLTTSWRGGGRRGVGMATDVASAPMPEAPSQYCGSAVDPLNVVVPPPSPDVSETMASPGGGPGPPSVASDGSGSLGGGSTLRDIPPLDASRRNSSQHIHVSLTSDFASLLGEEQEVAPRDFPSLRLRGVRTREGQHIHISLQPEFAELLGLGRGRPSGDFLSPFSRGSEDLTSLEASKLREVPLI